jgi:hypothetical protein
MRSVPRGYKQDKSKSLVSCEISRVEAGSNTPTVSLRVVGGDEKGSLESETVKYGQSPMGVGPENDCAGEDQQQL